MTAGVEVKAIYMPQTYKRIVLLEFEINKVVSVVAVLFIYYWYLPLI